MSRATLRAKRPRSNDLCGAVRACDARSASGQEHPAAATAPRGSAGLRAAVPRLAVFHTSFFDELDEGAERRLGVDEGDRRAPAARAGGLVDHLVALGLHAVEGGR